MPASRVILGTVQFGLPYGVANTIGQVTQHDGRAILEAAWAHGMRALDTAIAYGNSEAVLGALGVERWQVITKLPALPRSVPDARAWVREQVDASMRRLRVPSLAGLLLHRPADLTGPDGAALYNGLSAVRDEGLVARVGISVYGPEDLEQLPPGMRFDIVQAPWNVLDQRMTRSGWAPRLRENGCEFHARSLFLQGLLLMRGSRRPAYFAPWHHLFGAWETWLRDEGLTPVQACLRHALEQPAIDRVVIGVDAAAQLTEILAAVDDAASVPPLPAGLTSNDVGLLNPARWSIQ